MVDDDFLTVQDALAGVYSIERELGRGGMGIVYLAREVWLDRLVAIKVLPPALATRPELRERFLREARTSAQLSHPNIVPIYHVDERDDLVYFVMSYIDGGTLGERVRREGPLRSHDAARIAHDVALALDYGHLQGVIHRDIKPDNILLDAQSGRAVVTDFGIARVSLADGSDALDGEILGTAHYVSPEQAIGGAVDGRSDLYSLGIVTFFALTGTLPFQGGTSREVVGHHLATRAPSLAEIAPGVPPLLAAAVDQCLAKAAGDRFATCADFAGAIHAATVAIERPAPIRAWLEHSWRAPSAILGAGAILSMVYLPASGSLAPWAAFNSVFLLSPLAVAAMGRSRATVRLLRAGYTFDDIRSALAETAPEATAASRRVVRRRGLRRWSSTEAAPVPPEKTGVARLFAVASGTVVASTGAVLAFMEKWRYSFPRPMAGWPRPWPNEGWYDAADTAWQMLYISLPVLALSLAVNWKLIGPAQWIADQRAVLAQRRRWFWGSRLAEWLFLPFGSRPRVTQAGDRPTEMALGAAAADAYWSLTPSQQRALGDVPALVLRLDDDARETRARLASIDAELARARGAEGPPDATRSQLADARRMTDEHLKAVVRVLENVRLGLVRMGTADRDLEELTTDLAAAARITRDVDAAMTGYSGVADLFPKPDGFAATDAELDADECEPTPV